MVSEKLPAVLKRSNNWHNYSYSQGISMERALRQIKELLDSIESEDASVQDRVNASIDDVDTMLAAIDR